MPKRLENLGSIAFGIVMISFTFHILAISLNHWKENICVGCKNDDVEASWSTSLRQRCYESSMATVFFKNNHPLINSFYGSFITQICIPNKYLMAKDRANALDCLMTAINRSDTACALGIYNKDHCYCDYTPNTKALLTFSILASFSLGIMVFLSHFLSFITIDYILRWLIPVSLSLLSFSIICMLGALITTGIAINEDVNELRYSSSLVESAVYNVTELDYWKAQMRSKTEISYTVKLGWCFGLEVMATYFAVVALLIYTYVFNAKKRRPQRK